MCYLFDSVGKQKSIAGCTSGGAFAPPPPPWPPSAGVAVRLSSLGLDSRSVWNVRSVWEKPSVAVPVINGSFESRPQLHDVEMYVISQ